MSSAKGGGGEGVVVYDDFSRGDWGDRGSWGLGRGWVSAENLLRYADGSVGPRLGLKEIPLTGVPNGEVTAVAAVDDPTSGNLTRCLFTVGADLYRFNPLATGAQAVTAHGALASAPVPNQLAAVGGDAGYAYISTNSTTLYRVPLTSSGAVAAVAGAPLVGGAMCRYGYRLVVSGSQGRRVYYSAPDDFASWPAANYFDVGDDAPVRSLHALRDRLVAAKQASLGSQWWVMTGVPGVDNVLRRVSDAPVPPRQNLGAVVGGSTVLGVYNGAPLWFDGLDPDLDRSRSVGTTDERRVRVLPGTNRGDAAVFSKPAGSGLRALVRRDGAWWRQSFTETASTAAVGALAAAYPGYAGVFGAPVVSGLFVVCDGGSAGAPARFYWLRLDNDRPARPGDEFAAEAPAGSITLPEHWASDGSLLRVRAVVVDYRAFSGLAPGNATMGVSVAALRQDEGAADSTPAAQQLSAAQPASDANRRKRFTLAGADFGNGFQVSIANIRGVAVQKVTVVYDAKAMRGAG